MVFSIHNKTKSNKKNAKITPSDYIDTTGNKFLFTAKSNQNDFDADDMRKTNALMGSFNEPVGRQKKPISFYQRRGPPSQSFKARKNTHIINRSPDSENLKESIKRDSSLRRTGQFATN